MADGSLHYVITGDNSDFVNKLDEIRQTMSKTSRQVEQEGGNIDAVMSRIASTAAAFGMGFSAVGFVKQVATVRGQFQALEQSFKTLLGSEEQANDLMKELTKTAAITPFDLQGVARGAKQLLAYGMAADKVNGKIIELGNIAAGMGLSIDYITQLYGTTVSKDHMDTMDLKQFKGQGIAIDEAIAEVMNVTRNEVPKLITAGEVTGEIVEQAISKLAGGDGQFAGMMANQSKTILGQLSNIEDAIDSMFNNIGKSSEGIISDVLGGVSYVVENYEEVGKAIAEVAVAFGAYKAALATYSALQGVQSEAEAKALATLLQTKEATTSIEAQELMAKQGLTKAQAEQIIELRAEVKERERLLQAELANVEAIEVEAVAKQQSAQKAVANLEQEIAMSERNIAALNAQGKTRASIVAQQKLQTQQQTLLNAKKELEIATTNAQAASTTRLTAQRRFETFQLGAQTAAQTAMTRSTSLCARAQEALGKAMKATGLSMLANPFVAAAAAAVALGYAIYKIVTYETDAEKAIKKVNEAHKEAQAEVVKETAKLSSLCDVLKTADKNSQEYADAKDRLLKFADKYDPKLRAELENIKNIDEWYTKAAAAVHAYYMQKAKDAAMDTAETEYAKAQVDAETKVYEQFEKIKKNATSNITDEKQAAEEVKRIDKYFAEVKKAMESGTLKVEEVYDGFYRKTTITGGISQDAVNFLGQNGMGNVAKEIADEAANLQAAAKTRKAAYDRAQQIFNTDYNAGTPEAEAYKAASEAWEKASGDYAAKIASGIDKTTEEFKKSEANYYAAMEAFRKAGGNPISIFYQDQYNDAKRAWDDAKAALKTIEADRAAYTTEQYNKAVANEKRTKEAFEKLGGDTSGEKSQKKTADDAKKREASRKRLADAQAQTITDAERIGAKTIENSVEKELANIQATYEDNIKKIQRQREDIAKAQKEGIISKDEARQYNEQLDAFDSIGGTFDKQREAQAQQFFKKQIEEMSAVGLQQHEKYEQQKTQITEQWEKKRAELQSIIRSEHATEEQKAAAAQAIERTHTQEKADIAKVDLEEFKNSDYYKNVFGDLQNYGETTINAMMAKLQEFAPALKESLNPEDLKEFEDAMQQLQLRMVEIDPFGALSESKEALDKALRQKAEAQENLVAATTREKNIRDAIERLSKSGVKDEQRSATLKKQLAAATDRVSEAAEDYAEAEDEVAKNKNAFNKALTQSMNAVRGLSDELQNVGNQVGGMFGDITNAIGSIVNLVEVSANAMELTSSTATGVLKAIETASVILAIIGAVMQAMQALKRVFGGDKSRDEYDDAVDKQREINKLTDSVRAYRTAVLQAELAEKNWFSSGGATQNMRDQWTLASDALQAYHEKEHQLQVKYQDRQAGRTGLGRMTENLVKSWIGDPKAMFELGKQTWNPITGTKNVFAGADNTYSTNTVEAIDNMRFETRARKHGTWFRKGKSQQTTDLRSWAKEHYGADLINETTGMVDIQMAESILNDYGDKLVGDTKETLEKLKEQAEAYEEAIKAIKESTSELFSPLVDNMTDAVWAWFTEGEDAMLEFKDLANDTFISIAKDMTKTLSNKLIFQNFSAQLDEVAEKYARGEITEEEFMSQGLALLDNTMKNAGDKVKAVQEFLNASQEKALEYGYDLTGSRSDQEATYGGYETMSEQTGTELSGRFSAMYMVQSEQLALSKDIHGTLSSGVGLLSAQYSALQDIATLNGARNILLTNFKDAFDRFRVDVGDTLNNIAKYTKTLE